MSHRKGVLKRRLEYIGMFPFVLAGMIYGRLFPLKKKTSTFLFFPSADIGGAIKVNADIAACMKDQQPLIIFSKKPKNNGHLEMFQGFDVLDLHEQIDNKLYHFVNFFYRGVLAAWINSAPNATIFGGESLFFYKMLAHVNRNVRRIELCHLDTWLPYSIGFIDLITLRIFSTVKLMKDVEEQYKKTGVNPSYAKRLRFAENMIPIPPYRPVNNETLEVIFIGRGAPQKRVPLIAAIAEKLHQINAPIHFSFVGDVDNVIDPAQYPYCTFYGNVRDEAKMLELYHKSDVLILTSAYEGLPLVVMQMMAHGRIVMSTAVNAIPDYVRHMENGLLIHATSEPAIVEEGATLLQWLVEHPEVKETFGKRGREIAIEKFSGEVFCREFRKFLYTDNDF
ncbi:glycosyltransferase family 4 protein [Pseudobacter ginsenosidimutans]|jgi:glycosyltransferase involved in cell wall biosynthesis|uniref:Glycosyltransferase involved in cell wall biosynthesis n=1 Tax=Pseudobacter ginsenosidimutans TaxID=661488 RepID=A0A4Q7N0Z9_9BACT|nr:glycosyltransferase family 4 protein [Pseudobacter ginsenosidimutans]QEC43865.1 glycosyltransferase family 4 protein [Pseudobacter ginsenosidimutans]RZS75291.1 glycosyltransferase involved in cell wall biosynthesis [Pseudobacter ginsenosidimutans]